MKQLMLMIIVCIMVSGVPQSGVYALDQILPSPTPPVEYYLPYPGILTNHPLYFLKKFRDSIMESLISSPVKKAEFYMLQSDKFLAMSLVFAGDTDWYHAKIVLTKSDSYLTRSVSLLTVQQEAGILVPGHIIEQLDRSIAKHTEVYRELQKRARAEDQPFLSDRVYSAIRLAEEIKKLQSEKK